MLLKLKMFWCIRCKKIKYNTRMSFNFSKIDGFRKF